MHSALVRKEILQCGLPCLVSLLLCAVMPYWLHNEWAERTTPFIGGFALPYLPARVTTVADSLVCNFSFVGGLLAIAIGLIQSAGESLSGTWQYLLFRPVSRARILTVKLLTGGGLLLVSTAIPGLAYALWAATPGNHSGPFEWWMTEKFWQQWISLPLLYFTSFLCGLNEGSWYGLRLMPVPAVGAICVALAFVPFWSIIGPVVLLTAYGLILITLYTTMQTRAFSS